MRKRMRWGAATAFLLAVVLSLSSCATLRAIQGEIAAAISATDERTWEASRDPVRERHLLGRTLESCMGGVAVGFLALPFGPLIGCPVAALVEFIVYEYLLEPISVAQLKAGKPTITGPYFERGPRLPVIYRDGSLAERGEIYREATEADCKFYRKMWHPDPQRPSGGWCE